MRGLFLLLFCFCLSMTIANKKTRLGETLHICKICAIFFVVMNSNISFFVKEGTGLD